MFMYQCISIAWCHSRLKVPHFLTQNLMSQLHSPMDFRTTKQSLSFQPKPPTLIKSFFLIGEVVYYSSIQVTLQVPSRQLHVQS